MVERFPRLKPLHRVSGFLEPAHLIAQPLFIRLVERKLQDRRTYEPELLAALGGDRLSERLEQSVAGQG